MRAELSGRYGVGGVIKLRVLVGRAFRSCVSPAVAFDDDVIGIVWGFVELDFFDGEGGVEAEVVAVGEKPIADGAIDPSLDAAEDVGNARWGDAEGGGNFLLFDMPGDGEPVDIEVSKGGDFWWSGHGDLRA
jgi:hypothetical protein